MTLTKLYVINEPTSLTKTDVTNTDVSKTNVISSICKMPTSLGSSLQKYIDYYRYVERSLTEEKRHKVISSLRT